MPRYTERTISLKTLLQHVWSTYKPFLNQYAGTFSWKVVYGWMYNITKNERKYKWSAVYQHKNNPWVTYLYDADVNYHLDCWLGVSVKYRYAGRVQLKQPFLLYLSSACNRQHRWLDIALTNMNAGLVQVYQTCMLVGASLTDMTAG